MKVKLILVGKTSERYIEDGFNDFQNRLKHYCDFELIVIKDVSGRAKMSVDELKNREGKLILNEVKEGVTFLLDEKGKEVSSVGFSELLDQQIMMNSKSINFIIGGAYGFSDEVYQQKFRKLSWSKMTFTHQMIRLLFIEQLYRAFTILKGEKYHHV